MKHIFIYFAPAYFLFYFNYIVINNIKKKKFKKLIINLVLIGLGILSVLIITFLPFIIISIKTKSLSQFIQIKERLFPLNRGLLHTYWAPNFWALYSLLDKILYYAYKNYSNQFSIIDKVCSFFLKYKDYNYKRNTSSTGAGENGVSKPTGFDILPDISMKTTIKCLDKLNFYKKKCVI
jgi:alpha-1,3-glucosyltransferase